MKSALLFVHALSPLHAGTGQSIGAIDLAIARDRATGFPYLPGTSLKGSLRDRASSVLQPMEVQQLFGPETEKASEHAGAAVFGDAYLLLLPVRSVAGTFAWVTSPYLLARFQRDVAEVGKSGLRLAPSPSIDQAITAPNSLLAVSVMGQDKVVLEDLDLRREGAMEVSSFGQNLASALFGTSDEVASWSTCFHRRLCIVHDDVMSFLSQHATEVVARVAIKDETKTVKDGALWYEESLPTETILVSLVAAVPNGRTKLAPAACLDSLKKIVPANSSVQLGGKATVGRGRCRLILERGGAQ